MARVFIGLGANLGKPLDNIRAALDALAELPDTQVCRCSSFYRSRPLEDMPQPDYVNAVAELETALPPEDLLSALQNIETTLGRVRDGERWGPRTLDLDILLYDDLQIDTPTLRVPHPEISRREFVVLPLTEIAPGLHVPGLGPIIDLCSRLDRRGMEKIEDSHG